MTSNTEVYSSRRRTGSSKTQRERKSSTPKATPPFISKPSPTGPYKPDTKEFPRIKAIISKYQKLLAEEHGYIVVHALRSAMHIVNQRLTGSEAGLGDEVSPFKDMPAIDHPVLTPGSGSIVKEKDLTMGRFTMRHYIKPGNPGPEVKLQVKGHIAPSPSVRGIPPLPKYHAYITLRNNILAEDDEVMRYFPYFGEDAADNNVIDMLNLEEAFVDKTKNAQEENMRAEKGIIFVDYVDRFLSEVDLDMNAVASYLIGELSRTGWSQQRKDFRDKFLPEDFDHTEPKVESAIQKLRQVSTSTLERAEAVCSVFMDMLDCSLWEVVQRADDIVKESMTPARTSGGNQGSASKMIGGKTAADAVAILTGGNPQPYSLESYAALNCLYCYMHECPFHVNNNKDSIFLSGNGAKLPYISTPGSRKHAFPEGAECSKGCFIKATDEDRAKKVVWTKAQIQLLQASAVVLRENPRASCLMACVINNYCYEIQAELQRRGLISVPEESPIPTIMPVTDPADPNNKATLKRKRPNPKQNGEYPADCHKTPNANERTYFKPCLHIGACTSDCQCVRDKVMCEKTCLCEPDCPRKWRGCRCASSGRACTSSSNCPCVRWNRECDPDLCSHCGAAETLSPSNRYDEELASQCCHNVALQRDVPRRTILGVSGVSGLGLFIGENVKKDTFLGEYKGEIISNDEAERRGKLYDKRGVSFLFNLNKTQVIDATRAGNKFRFVNHYKKPNCFAKVLFANCTHRIGMFAKRDLVAGEELYFDYGYNNKSVQFIAQEPDFVFQPPPPIERVARRSRVTNRGNWDTGHTVRTSMKKLLNESAANGALSNAISLPLGSRNRMRSNADIRGITGTNTPSITDAASDTPGVDDTESRLGSQARWSDEDSDDEPVRGRNMPHDFGYRSQSTNEMWEIEASNDEEIEEGDDDEDDHDDDEDDHDDDDDDQLGTGRRSTSVRGEYDEEEEEEEEDEVYQPSRRVQRRIRRERERAVSIASGKRRRVI